MKTPRKRADLLLVERGLFESRARAQAAIEAGLVTANDKPVLKASENIAADAVLQAQSAHPFVSRGGVKLSGALERYPLEIEDHVCLDVGASTGGFTEVLLTVEEGSIGGFGSHVMQTLAEHGMLDGGLRMRAMVLPDEFLDHDSPNAMYARAGLDAKSIVAKVFEALGKDFKTETVKLA